jgi:enoyl-CoA hydratase/carnithine racemase
MTQISIDRDGPVLIATIANPPDGFMDEETETELAALLDTVEMDESIRAVVLTGGLPGVFIRHYDVRVLAERGQAMAERGMTFDLARPVPERPYHAVLRRIETVGTPFVAALNGIAMGGGFELTLACDFRLAAAGDYRLGLPEINIGLLPGAGGTQRLARLIGEGKTLELILAGRTVGPEEAARLGMVSECVSGDLMERPLDLARILAGKPRRGAAHIKRLVRGATARPLDDGLADERTLFCDLVVDAETLDRMAEMNAGRRAITDE